MGKSGPLTDKQETFCQEYLKDLNATQAATRAGYSEKTANEQGARLLANVSVAARVKELMALREKRTQITADKVLQDIEEIKIRCMQGEPVLDKEGMPTGEWKFEAHAALKACELQGKHLKLFTDKVEQTSDVNITAEIKIDATDLSERISQIKGKK